MELIKYFTEGWKYKGSIDWVAKWSACTSQSMFTR